MDRQDTIHVQLLAALTPILERLQRMARTDPAVRAELRRLGETLVAFATESQVTELSVDTGLLAPPITAAPVAIPVPTDVASAEKAPTLQPKLDKTIAQVQTADPTAASLLGATPPTVAPSRSSTIKPPAHQPKKPAKAYTTVQSSKKSSKSWVAPHSVQLHSAEQLPQAATGTAFELSALAQRCAIKQAGAVWAAARQQRLAQGIKNDLQLELDRQQLIQHAQLLADCYLWMCQREAPSLVTAAQFEHLAGCFAGMMDAAVLLNALIRDSEEQAPFLEEAFNLAAEAQAALRKAVAAVDKTPDNDQVRFYQWLKAIAARDHMQIRYMTKRNAADPAAWSALQARIRTLATKIQGVKQSSKERKRLMGKVRHRCQAIQEHVGAERLDDWQRLAVAVTELIETGLPPSNIELREHLLPVIDDLPEALELSKNFHLVLRELDRFLATRLPTAADTAATSAVTSPIAEVQRVRALLHGRTMIVIGGERRPGAIEALTLAFDLKALIWIEAYEQTYTDFEPHVARADVAVVILAIRWVPHGYGEVKEFCDQYSKPLVRLPAGYNPNQVAYTILNQVSHQLAASQPLDQGEPPSV